MLVYLNQGFHFFMWGCEIFEKVLLSCNVRMFLFAFTRLQQRLFFLERHGRQCPDCFGCFVFLRSALFLKMRLPPICRYKLAFFLQALNVLLSNTFRKFSLIDRIFQCWSITFLMLGNVLLKVSTNGKFLLVDGFSLFSNRNLRSTLWLFQNDGPEF